MKPSNSIGEYVLEASKASPPITVAGFSLAGVSLADWVLIATLIYTLMQIGWFIYDKFVRTPRGAEI